MKTEIKRLNCGFRLYMQVCAMRRELACADGGQWLNDNYYLAAKTCDELCERFENLPPLPCVGKGIALILIICRAYLKRCEQYSPEDFERYLRSYQSHRALSGDELTSTDLFLRYSALEIICDCAAGRLPEKRYALAFKLLRDTDNFDFGPMLRRLDKVGSLLRRDPAGIYARMDEKSRAQYRERLSRLALAEGKREDETAAGLLKKAESAETEKQRHIGFYLQQPHGRSLLPLLLPAFTSALLCAASGVASGSIIMPFAAFLPVYEIVRPSLHKLLLSGRKPALQPKLAVDEPIGPENALLITLCDLLPKPENIEKVVDKLARLYRLTPGGSVYFCLLADPAESEHATLAADFVSCGRLCAAIRQLNNRLDDRFFVRIRPRSYIRTQGKYAAKERKRGAIAELCALIASGRKPDDGAFCGNIETLGRIKYLLVLDCDTEPELDAVQKLLGSATHLLNRPEERDGTVRDGYAVFAPRVTTRLESAYKTVFSLLFCGDAGVSAYDSGGSELYQELYGSSVFCGKGLIDVGVYNRLCRNLPPERILSHDIIEGSLLRCRYLPDAELEDDFPPTPSAWLRRRHRWIRGDAQNLYFLGDKRLCAADKFKLLDNIRRALTPSASLLCILLGNYIASPAISLAFTSIGLFSILSERLYRLTDTVKLFIVTALTRRSFCGLPGRLARELAGCAAELCMLIPTAVSDSDALIRTLWRCTVTGKNLLEWTTAAQSESEKSGKRYVRLYLPSALLMLPGRKRLPLLSLLCLASSGLGLLSRPLPGRKKAGGSYTEFAANQAEKIWGYFSRYVTAEDNFLPPDNLQLSPVFALAHRTSPTNIGFYLCSAVSAYDFGLIGLDELLFRIDSTLTTVEKLPKYRGHLYNWYDTRTAAPLNPEYVSTVDSGNFLCCLAALKSFLKSVFNEDGRIGQLLTAINTLQNQTDFSFLYDSDRAVFSIGRNTAKDKADNSYYDLLMSEARLTGYYAVATRQAPRAHWRALGRLMTDACGVCGPLSWSGSAFEYLMPYIFLPVCRGSLDSQALKLCLRCQSKKRFGKRGKRVWGVSESAFFAFDSQLNYRYKSNGVNALALRRCDVSDAVVSPYSSFLALPFAPDAAVKNLRTLDAYAMQGEFGYYEALDFSDSRTDGSAKPVVCYMAHHLGMSLLSLGNYAHDFIWNRRFMADEQLSAADELLKERPAEAAVMYKRHREQPQRFLPHGRVFDQVQRINRPNPVNPACNLLSGGGLTLITADSGSSYAIYCGKLLTEHGSDLLRRPRGIFALLRRDGKVYDVTAAPNYAPGGRAAEFSESETRYLLDDKNLSVGLTLSVCSPLPVIKVTLAGELKEGDEYLLTLFPALCDEAALNSHYAFRKLFINARYDDTLQALILHSGQMAMAVGTYGRERFDYTTDATEALTRPEGINSLPDAFDKAFASRGWSPDNVLLIRGGAASGCKLLIAAGQTEKEALLNLETARRQKSPAAPESLGILQPVREALPALVFGRSCGDLTAAKNNTLPRQALWALAISGDDPILLLRLSADDIHRAQTYFGLFGYLRIKGIRLDLAVLYDEDGEYSKSTENRLRQAAEQTRTEPFIGQPAGIQLLRADKLTPQQHDLLAACAAYIVPSERVKPRRVAPYSPFTLHSVEPLPEADGFTQTGYVCNGAEALPQCLVLANPAFGTLVSDRSAGFSWALNSQLNKLTAFGGRAYEDNRAELLLARVGGRVYNLLRGATAIFEAGKVTYKCRFAGLEAAITISVPQTGMMKQISIGLTGAVAAEVELVYYCEPAYESALLKSKWDGELTLYCAQKGFVRLGAVGGCDGFNCDRSGFWRGRFNDGILYPNSDGCAAVLKKVKAGESATFYMVYSAAESGLIAPHPEQYGLQTYYPRLSGTGLKTDTLFNVFLPMQILNCRLYGRTGFYQNGGAWGLRDQLQDAMAAVYFAPQAAKYQLLRAGSVQFEQGDLLHWWHNCRGVLSGIRSRYADDGLWLAAAAAQYCRVTGDYAILNAQLPFLEAEALGQNERQRYFSPAKSSRRATLHAHILLAAKCAENVGRHGLCLFSGGDWNDGFNNAGIKGAGESVWLTMFAAKTLADYAAVCRTIGDGESADRLAALSDKLAQAAGGCWEKDRYIRGYRDNGKPLGSASCERCRLDITVQAFCILAEIGDTERQNAAADTVLRRLYDPVTGLVKLFDPPLEKADMQSVGYTAEYPAGVRENGGQYTHGAVWFAYALFLLRRADEGWKLLCGLNPRLSDAVKNGNFKAEPFLIPADISANPDSYGKAGWNLYTGAAGWFYRTVIEAMLGIKKEGGRITVDPSLPSCIASVDFSFELSGRQITLHYRKSGDNADTPRQIPNGPDDFSTEYVIEFR